MMEKLEIFTSLFKGRRDVFAIRWEKNGKNGYMPAYDLDWEEFRDHKAKGGSLKDFINKKYAALNDARLTNHFQGKEIIGIYPLLEDNTSWFIAADFDQTHLKSKSWLEDCRQFMRECEKHHLPVYLERSRSGTGGHVWLFFTNAYPALKSRQIFAYLLHSSRLTGHKDSSFDRLFPNQDFHSGKELGNLISLPLQQAALEKGNACFIDPSTAEPFPDQWQFLSAIKKVDTKYLNELYGNIFQKGTAAGETVTDTLNSPSGGKFKIILDNQIVLQKEGLPNLLLRYLRDTLNVSNPGYWMKKNTGRNTFGTEHYFKNIEDKDDQYYLPRGFIGNLIRYCQQQNIAYYL